MQEVVRRWKLSLPFYSSFWRGPDPIRRIPAQAGMITKVSKSVCNVNLYFSIFRSIFVAGTSIKKNDESGISLK